MGILRNEPNCEARMKIFQTRPNGWSKAKKMRILRNESQFEQPMSSAK